MTTPAQSPEIAALRERVTRALDGRRVWYYGFRGSGGSNDPPRGGQQVVSHHTRILRAAGADAYRVQDDGPVARRNPFSRPDGDERAPEGWFRRQVDTRRDVIVVPGFRMNRMRGVPGDNVVVFSQNVFVTARSLGLDSRGWAIDRAVAILAVSEGNAELIRLAGAECPVLTIRTAVDPERFRPGAKERLVLSNGLNIGCEKNPFDIAALAQILRARSGRDTEPFEFRAIERLSHEEVARLLARARVLVFPSSHEGLGLLPLEAMLAGAVVFGWRRAPMTEYLPARCQFDFGDLSGVADAVVDALDHPDRWRDAIEEGRANALEFSAPAQERSVLETWLEIAGRL